MHKINIIYCIIIDRAKSTINILTQIKTSKLKTINKKRLLWLFRYHHSYIMYYLPFRLIKHHIFSAWNRLWCVYIILYGFDSIDLMDCSSRVQIILCMCIICIPVDLVDYTLCSISARVPLLMNILLALGVIVGRNNGGKRTKTNG